MKTRYQLIINVRTASPDLKEFLYQTGEFSCEEVSEKIYNFIRTNAAKLGFNFSLDESYFYELVKNAYDAYAERGLQTGQNLELKVVIKAQNQTLQIKIKDNGTGFKDLEKGRFFKLKDISYQQKNKLQFLGGGQLGLKFFSKNVEKNKGVILFKNREKEGAAIYLTFNKDEDTPTQYFAVI